MRKRRRGAGLLWLVIFSFFPGSYGYDMATWSAFAQWLNRPRPMPKGEAAE